MNSGEEARFPARGIEDFIERQILSVLSDTRKMVETASVDHVENYEELKNVVQKSTHIDLDEIFGMLKRLLSALMALCWRSTSANLSCLPQQK
jgi:hypothetical protein